MNHVLLVSDQPMPNFLPILNAEMKPDSVTLVVSHKMRQRAEWLKSEIKKHQVQVLSDIELGDDVSDINTIQGVLMGWADNNKDLFNQSILNVTGGTKPMAIAAQEAFRMGGRPVFYIDIATDNVTWLNNEKASFVLSNQPTLKQYLGLCGITIESGDFKSEIDNEKWRHFYNEVSRAPQKWASTIRALNKIAKQAEDDKTNNFEVSDDILALPSWSEMSEMLHADELVRYKESGLREAFYSEEARRFCNGIWLEHYVFALLKEEFGFDKKRALMNVKILDAKGNRNELDTIVLHKNTCYIIEDKTKNMSPKGAADMAVYKLAQLSAKMGLRAKGILVSALSVRSVDKERARAYNVDVIDWLPDLENNFRRIFGIVD